MIRRLICAVIGHAWKRHSSPLGSFNGTICTRCPAERNDGGWANFGEKDGSNG